VAEVFHRQSGQDHPLAETDQSFEEICDGQMGPAPESAFMYVGGVEASRRTSEKKVAQAISSHFIAKAARHLPPLRDTNLFVNNLTATP